MAITPPKPDPRVCEHGVAADRLLPCRVCRPEAFVPTEDRDAGPRFEDRLRALEEEFAYLKRPIRAAGFEITISAATGPEPASAGAAPPTSRGCPSSPSCSTA